VQGGTRRGLSTKQQFSFVDRQSYIEFYIDSSTSVGNALEYWLYNNDTSFAMSSLTIWGNGSSSLITYQNIGTAAPKRSSILCNFALGSFYMLYLRAERPHAWRINSTSTWKLVSELIDSATSKTICSVSYTNPTMTYINYVATVFNTTYALVVSQSNMIAADMKRILQQQPINVFVDRVGIECQSEYCGGNDALAIYSDPVVPPEPSHLLELILYTSVPSAAAIIAIFVIVAIILLIACLRKHKQSVQQHDNFDNPITTDAWYADNETSGYSIAIRKYPHHRKL
jgi:hypothetical protein